MARTTVHEYFEILKDTLILYELPAWRKSKNNLSPNDIKPLRMLAEEGKLKRYICVSMEPRRRRIGNIDVLPYKEFWTFCGTKFTQSVNPFRTYRYGQNVLSRIAQLGLKKRFGMSDEEIVIIEKMRGENR